jgi:predicted anti-sigma-YlaC factor YlaD
VAAGNFLAAPIDYPDMRCSDVRVAMSARLDGEEPGLSAGVVDAHLAGCAACTAWQDGADRVTRAVRVPAPVPDLSDQIMAAVAADPLIAADQARAAAAAEVHGRWQILRIAVALAAIVQLALALPTLIGSFLGTELGPHAGREMASFDIAVAVGFLFAAWRPVRARAYVPVALVLAGCLAATSGIDVLRGVTGITHEMGHLVTVVQAGLLWALGRVDRTERVGSTVAV